MQVGCQESPPRTDRKNALFYYSRKRLFPPLDSSKQILVARLLHTAAFWSKDFQKI